MGNHHELRVWRMATELAVEVDRESRRMPRGHSALADQLRRAALSIPTNLAEGASKRRDAEFARYIGIAVGSAAELDSLLTYAAEAGAMATTESKALLASVTSIRKMLFRLRTAISPPSGSANDQSPEPGDRTPATQ